MKKLVILSFAFLWMFSHSRAEVFIMEGIYQGKDIYVMNPFGAEGVGFCIYEVLVNGEVTSDEINSSAFAIDLAQYEFSHGDDVLITIRSKADCEPKVINPEAISPKSTCNIVKVNLNQSGELNWTTQGESGKLPFIIEHFKWNKWVQIGSVLGKGNIESNEYSVKIKLPAGENKLRIKQKDYEGEHISDEVTLEVKKDAAELVSTKVNVSIDFSLETHFELYNIYGELIETGYAKSIDVTELEKGRYYLNYEMSFGVEIKKK